MTKFRPSSRSSARRWLTGVTTAVVVAGAFGATIVGGAPIGRPQAVAPTDSEVLVGITPDRALDTRQAGGQPFGANETRTVDLSSIVPPEATSAVLNVTLDRATGESFVTVWPAGEPRPVASVNNAEPDQVMPNEMIAKLGTNRSISVYNERNSVDIIIDVVGYFVPLSEVSGAASNPAIGSTPGAGSLPPGLPAAVLDSTTYETVAMFTAPVDGNYALTGYVDVHWDDTATVSAGAAATAFCRWNDGNNVELGASITADLVVGVVTVPGLDTSNISVPGVGENLTAGDTVTLECRVDQTLAAGSEVEVIPTYTAMPVGSFS